eukprot:Skav234951  [mRNA]  locus=scaffold2817:105664:105930:- [translate_table: standard]
MPSTPSMRHGTLLAALVLVVPCCFVTSAWPRPGRSLATARGAAAAPAPVKPRPEVPQMPSSPDPRRMGEAVRWLMDEDVQKPPEWHLG